MNTGSPGRHAVDRLLARLPGQVLGRSAKRAGRFFSASICRFKPEEERCTKRDVLITTFYKAVQLRPTTQHGPTVNTPTSTPNTVSASDPLDASNPTDPPNPTNLTNATDEAEAPVSVNEARLWCNNGWTARVIKNEDDDGWAVEMIKDGEREPALVGPWTMGRDKKNPKPLDVSAFNTLVKTAAEVRRRHEQQLHALYHKNLTLETPSGRVRVTLDIVPDEDDPHALLAAHDAFDEPLAQVRVGATFKLSVASAQAWIDDDFRRPSGR